MRISTGDSVVIISGVDASDRPRKVIAAMPRESRVVVQGANVVKKHVRRSQKHPRGGRVEVEAPIHVSNVMLYCDACEKPTRAKMQDEGGQRIRTCRGCGAHIVGSKEK